MDFYSLNKIAPNTDFRNATINGLAPDKGLYFPIEIPKIEKSFFENIESISDTDMAFRVIHPFIGNTIPDSELYKIVSETINFPVPLVEVENNIFSLELFHGPTLAFKDVGARFMSRCLSYFVKERTGKVVVLVATSGDTGGAVANGFYGVENVEVVILYPSGKVSALQEKQLTTLGKNIHALEVKGSFDDCQNMVKKAFVDERLKNELFLTSANSINVARWLPQQFYYFLAYKQWEDKSNPPVIAVPSGNFGNICAGILANISGLPVKHFIAACNVNDVVPRYFETGKYNPGKTKHTISNAMDVGDPSNFIRMKALYGNDFDALSDNISSYRITDDETKETIRDIYMNKNYLLDTHGAVALNALKNYLSIHAQEKGIFLETAHPVKFKNEIEPVIGKEIELPEELSELMNQSKKAFILEADYENLFQFLKTF